MGLTRDEILSATDLKREEVDVPLWGKVLVSEMTAFDRLSFSDFAGLSEDALTKEAEHNLFAKISVRCLVDDSGERLFADEDYPLLAKKSLPALSAIAAAARRINGLFIKSVEDETKNSDPSASDALPSA
jgi:hypothetical protein